MYIIGYVQFYYYRAVLSMYIYMYLSVYIYIYYSVYIYIMCIYIHILVFVRSIHP